MCIRDSKKRAQTNRKRNYLSETNVTELDKSGLPTNGKWKTNNFGERNELECVEETANVVMSM